MTSGFGSLPQQMAKTMVKISRLKKVKLKKAILISRPTLEFWKLLLDLFDQVRHVQAATAMVDGDVQLLLGDKAELPCPKHGHHDAQVPGVFKGARMWKMDIGPKSASKAGLLVDV